MGKQRAKAKKGTTGRAKAAPRSKARGAVKRPRHEVKKAAVPADLASFLESLPVVPTREARRAKPMTPVEWKKLLASLTAPRNPTTKEWAAYLRARRKDPAWRQQQAEEYEAWKVRWKAKVRRVRNADACKAAQGRAVAALAELLDVAMHPTTLEDFATERIGEIIAEGLDCLAEIGGSVSPATTRAHTVMDKIKRRLKRAGDLEAKRRQRERERGGKSPRPWSKVLTGLVGELIAEVQAAHESGAMEFKGVALPKWSFGGAYGDDTRGLAVRKEWTDALMQLVDDVGAPRLHKLGAFDGNKWCDRQRDQARCEVKKCWQREENRRRKMHREWVAQGMVN
jgi:hypothetical protein